MSSPHVSILVLDQLPRRERPPDTISLRCKSFKYSSLYKRQTICRQIWIFRLHEFKAKKKALVLWIESPWHRHTNAFSNIWIQWSAFVQSAVARATQMCWQGFSQSAISRTASYNPSPNSLQSLFKRLASFPPPLTLRCRFFACRSQRPCWFCGWHFPNARRPMCNLVSVTAAAVSWK